MTEKLFYRDSHLKEFDAVVIACEKWEEGYGIVLDQTAFFPEGGGQKGDTGTLNDILVSDTQEKGDTVHHMTSDSLPVGAQVHGKLDFSQRFSNMQQHTGEHIVSGLMNRHFGYRNVGFHLGTLEVTMDFDGILTDEELRSIEWEANEAVAANLPVQETYPSKEELKDMQYRSKIEIEGQVRIVTIPGYDVCACCAPHVRNTGEIGMIKLTGAIHYKGGSRVSMLCGFRALREYQKKEESVSCISVLLSAKPDAVMEAVQRLKKESEDYRHRAIHFQEMYLAERLKTVKEKEENLFLFEEELDSNAMRRFVNKGKECVSGICGIFSGSDTSGYRYILGSCHRDLQKYAKKMNEALNGKGGGKPEMVQGTLLCSVHEIKGFLDNVSCLGGE